ncbi:MAG: ThuA domain-containing protein [Candidatus Sumerlaeota bacterium]|nr:ThuA domain-containing protein [Candidatus Sumerlaeota bacterium]
MKKACVLSVLCVLALSFAIATGKAQTANQGKPQEASKEKAIRILLTYGGHGFQEKEFYAMFDALPGVKYTKAQLPQQADLLKPGLEKEYDVLVMYDMTKGFKPEQRQAFADLLKTGIGVVSMHHNLCAHSDWPEYGRIIGGKYFANPETIDGKLYPKSTYDHDQELNVTVADKEHPITKGLKDFTIKDEAYGGFYTSPSVRVLLTTDHPKCSKSVAWVTRYGQSPIFFYMLGHDRVAWQNPAYTEILLRGIRWAAGESKAASAK